jgi:hypothetical protein
MVRTTRRRWIMSVAGTYKTTVKSPMGDQSGTLTVVPDGDTFSGSLIGSLGSMDIAGGTVEGNTIKWKMNIDRKSVV